jgi:glucan phosphoethanolaminetransferase (alkaline phosphatase superfamily)
MKKINPQQKKIIWDIITGVIFGLAVYPILMLYGYMASSIWTYIGQQTLKEGLPIIKEYSMICLTFFGVTLIGGIFNPREKDDSIHSKRIDYTKRSLLFISLIFLLAFVLLQMTVVKTYPLVDKPLEEIQSELNLIKEFYSSGLTLYTLGLIFLFWVLIGFFIIRYTHLPEKYDEWKERFIGLNKND